MNNNLIKRVIIMVLAVSLTIVSLLTLAKRAEAVIVTVDPGAVGTSSSYISDLYFGSLNGTAFNGQSQSLDFIFADNA